MGKALLILTFLALAAFPQAINLSGKVVDDSGNGISKARVELVGHGLFDITGESGDFSITSEILSVNKYSSRVTVETQEYYSLKGERIKILHNYPLYLTKVSKKTNGPLVKTSAETTDTLFVIADGFYPGRLPIVGYIQQEIEITLRKTVTTSAGLRFIPAGTFQMGQPNPDFSCIFCEYEGPVHTVSLSPFYIDTTEVTQADYLTVMGVNPSFLQHDSLEPVESVTWFDAVLYCNARSKRDGLDTVYSYTSVTRAPGNQCTALGGITIDYTKIGYRLPTEAEWEYAARGGTTTDYYWGAGVIDDYAWYSVNSGSMGHPVGGKLPNSFGLYDMSGNAFEWINDWYSWDYYPAGPVSNPTGVASGSRRGLRGGNWFGNASRLRSASRYGTIPDYPNPTIGFRVCLPSL